MARINPNFSKKLSKYGAFDLNACYNCGNCTAVCSLSTEEESFPRNMLRLSVIGLEDEAERRSWVRVDLSKANYAPVGNEIWLKRDSDGVLWGSMPPPLAVKESNSSRRKASDVDDSLIPW